jgi:hypothetical protein
MFERTPAFDFRLPCLHPSKIPLGIKTRLRPIGTVQVAGSTIIDSPSTTTPGSGGSLYAFLLTEKVSHSFHFVFGNSQHLYRIIGICFVYHDIALSLRKLFLFEKARQLSQMMIIETSYVTANR